MTRPDRPAILVTRPEPAASRFARQIAARLGADWPVIVSPLTALTFRAPALELAGVDGVIFTSESGVAGFARLSDWREAQAWCVGGRTAEAARAAGFAAMEGPGDVAGLLPLLLGPGGPRQPFWARGARVSVDLGPAFEAAGKRLRSAVVYDRARLPLTAAARACLATPGRVIWPVFSVGSAEDGLAALAGLEVAAEIEAVAMSAGVAHRLAAEGVPVRVAAEPTAAAMAAAVAFCAGAGG